MRSFVEIDVIFPYQIGSFLMFYAAGKLTMPRRNPKVSHPRFRPHSVPA